MPASARPAEILTGFIGSFLALLVAFGINLSDDQTAAVIAFVAWIPAVVTLVVELLRSAWKQAEKPQPTAADILERKKRPGAKGRGGG